MSVEKAVDEEAQFVRGISDVPTTTASGVATMGKRKNSEVEKELPGGMKHFLRIFHYGSKLDTALQVIGAICAVGSGTSLPLMAIIFGGFVSRFTDFAAGQKDAGQFMNDVNSFTLWFVYLFIGKFILTYVATTLFTVAALRITKEIRRQFIKATFRQEIAFFDDIGPGSVAVKATTNANNITTGIAEKFSRVLTSLSMIGTALIVGLTQSWRLTLIIVAAVFPLFVILSFAMTREANVDAKMLQVYSKAANLAEEVLGSIKTVRAFEANSILLKKYDVWLAKAMAVGNQKSWMWATIFGADFFFGYMPYALAFWEGARMFLRGDVDSVGRLSTVLLSVLMISAGIAQVAPSTTSFVQASSSAGELFATIDRKPKFDGSNDAGKKLERFTGDIEFRNVSFAYPSRPHISVLKGVSFDAPANKTTALVGASGSGKSTIVALMERWYELGGGNITIDGHQIETFNVKWLRSQMRLVQQEPVLFNDTIYSNIIHGLTGTPHENASAEQKMKLVVEACQAANASEFIDQLEEGYHTHVGERAGLLSGGQKQRIAIARSIISNPRILLLDEATSALDANSEGIVQNALDRVSKSRTTIVIAHKLATVMKADKIVVLGRGEVLEEGTHQDLVQKGGAYAKLVKAQNLGQARKVDIRDDDSDTGSEGGEKIIGEPIEERLATVKSWSAMDDDTLRYKDSNLLQSIVLLLQENAHMWPWYLTVLLFSLIGGGVYPAQAVLLSRLLTAFQLPRERLQGEVNFFALMFFVLALVALVGYAILGWSTNVISQALGKRYRHEMLESLLRQDIAFFDRPENASATLASKLSTSPTGLQDLMGMNVALILIVVFNILSNLILALVYGWKLALVIWFGVLPVIFGSGFLRIRFEMNFHQKISRPFADSARFASEAVGAMRTVVSFTIEDSITDAYDARLNQSLQQAIRFTLHTIIWFGLTESIPFLGMALAFWYGGKLISTGEYTTTQFFVIYVAIIFGGEAAAQFFAWTSNIVQAHAGANYILELRQSQASISSNVGARKPRPDSDYHFDKVHFRYPTRRHVPVLQGLDMKIKSGSSVAFVGGSGCGKSTAIGLLERYYDPSYGNLNFDSTPLPSLDLSNYRSNIALVSQEPTLYQGSIRENILLGVVTSEHDIDQHNESSEEKVVKAAKDANIYDFITSLPEGFGTECGSRGMQLSGGQKQRIAIARALVRDPKIMLLDEATSALDTTSEKLVQEALNNVSQGRTTISVAHRLSTIRDCDRIFVFDGGKVAEAGTHEELLELNGRYKKLCEAQTLDREA